MPRCPALFVLLYCATLCFHSVSAWGGDNVDPLPDWRMPASRVTVIGGPTGVSPSRYIAPSEDLAPVPSVVPMVDRAVVPATFQSDAGLGALDPSAPTFESPSDHPVPVEPVPVEIPEPEPLGPIVQASAAHDTAPTAPYTGAYEQPSAERSEPGRRLLSSRRSRQADQGQESQQPFLDFQWDAFTSDSVTTVGASLVMVVGLLFLFAWIWRRAAPRSARPLPAEVVSVIGRIPLANRQVAQMMKIGHKLVLVCVRPDGVEPITEVTDPEEVTRLLGLCEQSDPRSASAAFREVFDQMTREPAAPGFLGDEAPVVDRQKLADAYANTPGGRAYG